MLPAISASDLLDDAVLTVPYELNQHRNLGRFEIFPADHVKGLSGVQIATKKKSECTLEFPNCHHGKVSSFQANNIQTEYLAVVTLYRAVRDNILSGSCIGRNESVLAYTAKLLDAGKRSNVDPVLNDYVAR